MNNFKNSIIYKNYDYFVIDIFGVIHDGIKPYEEAIDFVNKLTQEKRVIFLSNMPRPSLLSYKKILELGIKGTFDVVTSGDLVRYIFQKKFKNKIIYHWGEDRNTDICEGLNLNLTKNIEDAHIILLTFYMEETENFKDQEKIIEKIIQLRKPIICANPDEEAIFNGVKRFCSGYFAKKLEALGGRVLHLGKPNLLIYRFLENKYKEIKINRSKVLMLGDTLETDIRGAYQYGYHTFLILSGITGNKLRESNISLENYIRINNIKYKPDYVIESFKNII